MGRSMADTEHTGAPRPINTHAITEKRTFVRALMRLGKARAIKAMRLCFPRACLKIKKTAAKIRQNRHADSAQQS